MEGWGVWVGGFSFVSSLATSPGVTRGVLKVLVVLVMGLATLLLVLLLLVA